MELWLCEREKIIAFISQIINLLCEIQTQAQWPLNPNTYTYINMLVHTKNQRQMIEYEMNHTKIPSLEWTSKNNQSTTHYPENKKNIHFGSIHIHGPL